MKINSFAGCLFFAATALLSSLTSPSHAQTTPSSAPATGLIIDEPALAQATARGKALARQARWKFPAASRLLLAGANRLYAIKGIPSRGTPRAPQSLIALDLATGAQLGADLPVNPGAAGVVPVQEWFLDIGDSKTGPELLQKTGAPSASNLKIAVVNARDKAIKWELPTTDYQALPIFVGSTVVAGAELFPLQLNGGIRGRPPNPTIVPMAIRAFDRATGEPRWSWPLPEMTLGTSRPVPSDGNIFFAMERIPNAQSRDFTCSLGALDAQGKPLWPIVPIPNAISTPAVGSGKLVISTVAGTVVALDAATGKESWQTVISPAGDVAVSRVSQMHDPATFPSRFLPPPVIDGDQVIVAVCGPTTPHLREDPGRLTFFIGGLAALDVHTGKQNWFFRAPQVPGVTPAANVSPQSLDMQLVGVQISGGHIIAQAIHWRDTRSHVLGCLSIDRRTGQLEWFLPMTPPETTTAFRLEPPIVFGNTLILRMPDPVDGLEAGLYAIDLYPVPALAK